MRAGEEDRLGVGPEGMLGAPLHSGVLVCLSLSCSSLLLSSQFPVLGWWVGSQTFLRELHTQASTMNGKELVVRVAKR